MMLLHGMQHVVEAEVQDPSPKDQELMMLMML